MKAVPIQSFLTEETRVKVAQCRKEKLVLHESVDGEVSLQAKEVGHFYVTKGEFAAANTSLIGAFGNQCKFKHVSNAPSVSKND